MQPVRSLTFDARPVAPQFLDGNPITDGLANLFASAINAPIAAGQIRHQRELEARQQMLQDRELERQAMLDDRAVQWHTQDQERQANRDAMAQTWQEAQIGNMKADNARQMASMFGNGLNNAAARGIDAVKALRGLFGGGSAKGQSTPSASLWYTFKGDDGSMYKINRQSGEIVKAVPAATAPPVVQGQAFDTLRQTNPQLAEVMLGANRQANPVPWAIPGQPAAPPVQVRTGADRPLTTTASPGAPPVEAEFVTQHTTRLAGLPAGPARQDYLRRLRTANPALYQAVVQSLTSTAAR